jgi:hypothetical protein
MLTEPVSTYGPQVILSACGKTRCPAPLRSRYPDTELVTEREDLKLQGRPAAERQQERREEGDPLLKIFADISSFPEIPD